MLTIDVEPSSCGAAALGDEEGAVPNQTLVCLLLCTAHRQLPVDVHYYSPYKCYFLYSPLKQEAGNRAPCHVTSCNTVSATLNASSKL